MRQSNGDFDLKLVNKTVSTNSTNLSLFLADSSLAMAQFYFYYA